MRKWVIVATMFAVTGCSSTGEPEQAGAPVEDRTGAAGGAAAQPVETPPVAQVTPPARPGDTGVAALKDPKSILSKRSVYFDFDSFAIKDEYRPLIEAHARFLTTNPNMRMLIQGNTDERGSREYNVALGQKRSDAIRNMLMLLGVKESQIESVSLGEEKPRNPGHDEGAWADNRRGDMLYSGEF